MGEEKKSVAILPFKNISHDEASSFYEFSLADAVITELAKVRSLVVRPSSVIAKYQGSEVDPKEIGRELGVGAVMSASFLRGGNRIRVNAQLLNVMTGDILWSDKIDVRRVAFPRPRQELIDLIGSEYQGLPMLVMDKERARYKDVVKRSGAKVD